jgi:uncharacterized membrane protein YvbJ
MKLVEKKCPNCGANIEFNSENKTVTCNYCNTTFEVERDLEQELKEEIVLRFKEHRKISKTMIIVIIVMFIVITAIILLIFGTVSSRIGRF